MERMAADQESARRSFPSGIRLVGALVVLAFGVRVAGAVARTTLGRCLLEARCDGSVEAALASPGVTLLGLTIIALASVPLVFWLRGAGSCAQKFSELSRLATMVLGYLASALAVVFGSQLVVEGSAWWSVSGGIILWIVGFIIVTVSFSGNRRAQALYVLAVIAFPLLMSWLLSVPTVS